MEPYGELFTVEDWFKNVENGYFIPNDGVGYYGTETEEWPQHSVWGGEPPEGATHVWWYNK
jgi:hypothetical protein